MNHFRSSAFKLLVFIASTRAWACKPCESGPAYSIRNNSTIVVGRATRVGKGPAEVLAHNLKHPGALEQKPYTIDVDIEVEEVLSLGKDTNILPGKKITAQSGYGPPCKSLVTPQPGQRYVFFPEDLGNCSQFAWAVKDAAALNEIKSQVGKKLSATNP